MPRLTHSTYCDQHDAVRTVWLETQPAWTQLSANEQWDLHDFYAPTHDFSVEELREYREKITALDPSLPQRAGRALRQLEVADAVYAAWVVEQGKQPVVAGGQKRKHRSTNTVVTVRPLVHPEIDTKRFAKALLALAKELADADRAKKTHQETADHDAAA